MARVWQSSSNATDQRGSDKVRGALPRFVLVLFVVLPLLAMIAFGIWLQERNHEQAFVLQQGRDLVNLQYELIQRELQSFTSDLLYLADQDQLRRLWQGDKADDARGEVERDFVRFARAKRIYDQIRILDLSGREVLRVNDHQGHPQAVATNELQAKTDRYYYQQSMTLDRAEVLVSPFDLNIENGVIEEPLKPVIRMITPIYDDAGLKRGLLVINYQGGLVLKKIAELAAGARGEVILTNDVGGYLLAPRHAKAWGWMLGNDDSCYSSFPEEWKRLTSHDQGQMVTIKGIFSYRWLDPLSPTVAMKMAPPVPPTQAGPNLSALLVLSHVAPAEAFSDSFKLLQRLCIVLVPAGIVTTALAWYWSLATHLRRQHERHIADSEARLRKLSSQLLAAQEGERRTISRQLHDEIGQLVTAASLDVRSASYQQDDARRNELLKQANKTIDELLKSLHRIASRVRPFILDDLGLHDALESYGVDFQRRTGIAVTMDLAIQSNKIPPQVADQVYRIVLEGLNNVAKHARAERAEVDMSVEDDWLRVTIRDTGVGFAWKDRDLSRLGLLGMQERTELLGGSFQIETAPGAGTRLSFLIPLRVSDELQTA